MAFITEKKTQKARDIYEQWMSEDHQMRINYLVDLINWECRKEGYTVKTIMGPNTIVIERKPIDETDSNE